MANMYKYDINNLRMAEFNVVNELEHLNFGEGTARRRQTLQRLRNTQTEEFVFLVNDLV